MLEQVGDHHPIELVQSRAYQARVCAAHRWVLTEAEEPLYLAGQHRVGERKESVTLSLKSGAKLRQVIKSKFVLARGLFSPPRLQQTHNILRRVLQPVGAVARIVADRRHP